MLTSGRSVAWLLLTALLLAGCGLYLDRSRSMDPDPRCPPGFVRVPGTSYCYSPVQRG